ncbi:MAG: FtsW/RodA/SpoVE family cell cycle protein [candidate division WOR-3 bacterium]|nr:FtsW/RodA/SpoVE family cell cycle protein [candidate division WOR-3 bacterium]MCX7947679.1 FtsW/RodA/SpoVE family cell cycle protein [candidate division WOR-3 bacterium]MDW8150556.1 FtsW/RodA/SpoVE family cell cycle protein [candidate division WOR-3 bacterium]
MVVIALLLSIVGILEIWTINKELAYKQFIFLLFSLLFGYLVYRFFKLAYIRTLIFPFFISLIFLLILTHITGEGVNRWINLKFFNLQPSELIRVFLPFLFFYYEPSENFYKVSSIILILLVLVLFQPDLGFAIAIAFVSYIVYFYSNVNRNFLIFIAFSIIAIFSSFNILSFILSLFILITILYYMKSRWYWTLITMLTFLTIGIITPVIWYNVLKPYQRVRIIAFLNPEIYRQSEAYQVYQSQIAIGSGKFFGNGYGEGIQKKYGFLPEAHTDFIFASICEDFGFIGGFSVITLVFILILWCLSMLYRIEDLALKRFVLSITLFFVYSFIVNISVNFGLMPTKGYPLLFISYGGSHLIVDYISLFLLIWVKNKYLKT